MPTLPRRLPHLLLAALPAALGLFALTRPAPVAAQQAAPVAPQKLGDFQSWTAAVLTEGTHKTCYAFVRARGDGGATRPNVLLTVTHRANARDTVTITPGFSFPRGAEPMVKVAGQDLPFYTAGSTAAARDGASAVRVFRNGRDAVMTSPGPNGRGNVTETFPLAGFAAAYEAIGKECPTGGGARR